MHEAGEDRVEILQEQAVNPIDSRFLVNFYCLYVRLGFANILWFFTTKLTKIFMK